MEKKRPGNRLWWWIIGIIIAIFGIGAATNNSNGSRIPEPATNLTASPTSQIEPAPEASSPTGTTSSATPQPAPAPTPTATLEPAPQPQQSCTNGSYVNSSGQTACSPETAPSAPAGATAQCNDGTYSFSLHHSGTCSHHGGVASWL